LRVDPHAILVALDRAFEHVADAKLLADLFGVDRLALVGEGRVARDDEAVVQARQFGCQIFGDPVGEIVLRRTAREIGERQNDDGQMRGFSGAVRSQEMPSDGGDHDERDDPGDERREHRTLF
jgi:hypothetical protein